MVKMILNHKKLLIFLLVLSNIAFSQKYWESGSPFIQTYSPDLYQANNQNWAIAQDKRGIIYFGNTNGILEFDGTKWNILQTSTNSSVRSLTTGTDGIVYVGGNGDLGFIAANNKFKTTFISLKNKLPEKDQNFSDIRQVCATSYGVYFFTKDKVFIYRQDTFQIHKFSAITRFAFEINDIVITISKDKALYAIIGNQFQKLPGTENIAENSGRILITNLNTQKILIATENKGFFTYDLSLFFDKKTGNYDFTLPVQAALEPFSVEFYEYFPKNNIYSLKKIDNNTIAIGTVYGGLVLIDTTGKVKQVIKKSNGLFDNSITEIYVDHLNNIWVTHLKGISYIHYNSKISIFSEKEGLEGSVYKNIRYNNKIYVSTALGLFVLNSNSIDETNTNKLQFIENTKERVWDLIIHKNKLFFITSSFLGIIEDDKLKMQFPISGYCMNIADNFPDILWIGSSDGLFWSKIEEKANKINFSKPIPVPEISTPVRYIVYFDNYLWIGTTFDGVYRVKIIDIQNNKFEITKFDKKTGIERQENCVPTIFQNYLAVCSPSGFYKIENNTVSKISPFKHKFLDTIGYNFLKKIQNSYIIVTSNSVFWKVDYDPKNNQYTYSRDLGAKIKGFQIYELYNDGDSILWLATNKGLVKMDFSKPQNLLHKFNAYFTKIKIGKDSVIFNGAFFDPKSQKDTFYTKLTNNPTSLKNEFEYKLNSISFTFSTNQYEIPDGTKYQYYLEGFDKDWSEWTSSNFKEYSYLREGKYTFRLKAKNLYDVESQEISFTFTILPPWYRTTYAYIAYVILAAAFIYLLIYLNSLRLKAENRRLERIIEERTAEIRQKNIILQQQKEEIQAQAETLAALNIELEKLAIVARETDNSIIIMDKEGNFLWANQGFEKIYGMCLADFKNLYGDNILKASSNKNIKLAVEECLNTKKSVIYESEFKRKNQHIWLQTTLTPILDEQRNITKIIAVETDISKIKEYEAEILQKNEEITAQKEELEKINQILYEQNEYIKAGIRYAKNIQNAILPIKSSFPAFIEHFVLYLPKDIVSGDYYWYTNLKINNHDYHYFAVVDCTGHGVPGAFMSLISNRLLTETVMIDKITETNEVLNQMREKIIKVLQQKETGNQDGMDMILIRVEKDNSSYKLQFSGAKRPLIFYNSQAKNFEIHKTDRISIGGYNINEVRTFTKTEITINTNDVLYLTSDGYIDQMNPEFKKLGTKEFIAILEEIIQLPMESQKEVLDKFFVEWKKNELQRDDVTVMGLKIL